MKVKIPIGIVIILFLLSACERIKTENTLVITTDDIEVFSEGIYKYNGTFVSMGNEEITDHGFCWAESEDPVINERSICLGARKTTGIFSSTIADFSVNTTYFVRAWAIAGSNTYYGEERSFTTPDYLPLTVTDIDNNIYHTVIIGDQIWMTENLKVTRYPDGSQIQIVEDQAVWYEFQYDDQAYCWYNNYGAIGTIYGGLYTWPAAMHGSEASDANPSGVQGVCPDGWHLPGDSEWKQLEIYLGMNKIDANKDKWRGTDEGGKMKIEKTQYWESPNIGATNESGFRALAGGCRHGDGIFRYFGISAQFWSSSRTGDYAWLRRLDNNTSKIYRNFAGLYEGHSVRCIKDK